MPPATALPLLRNRLDDLQTLEKIRRRIPRYLFHGWSPWSGGDRRYNTTTKIIQGAFIDRKGHDSAYELTMEQFWRMLVGHLGGDHIPTEFLSWAANISTAMSFCDDPDTSYISVIDTKYVENDHEISNSADLARFGLPPFPDEYLVHGIIGPDDHCATPYRIFVENEMSSTHISRSPSSLTPSLVRLCLRVAVRYEARFCMPVLLAILAYHGTRTRRAPTADERQRLLNVIEDTLGDDVDIHANWYNDRSIMRNVVANRSNPEVALFIDYLRHYAKLLQASGTILEQQNQTEQAREAAETAEESSETKRREIDQKSAKARQKLKKELQINMNRDGMKALRSFGLSEGEIQNKIETGEYDELLVLSRLSRGKCTPHEALEELRMLHNARQAADVEMEDAE